MLDSPGLSFIVVLPSDHLKFSMSCLLANVHLIPISEMPPLPRRVLLKISVHSDQQGILLNAGLDSLVLKWGLRLCIYNKLPGDSTKAEMCSVKWAARPQSMVLNLVRNFAPHGHREIARDVLS